MCKETPEDALLLARETDGALASQALAGNERAFEALVERYRSGLLQFLLRMLGDEDRAWDVLQHVLLQLYTHLPTLRLERTFKAWLFQVAHHRAIDELRHPRLLSLSELDLSEDEQGQEMTSPFLVDPQALPEEQVEYHELQQCLHQAIATLPNRSQTIVRLRSTTSLTFKEIGTILQISESTAKTSFLRAKPLLRRVLGVEHASELLPTGTPWMNMHMRWEQGETHSMDKGRGALNRRSRSRRW